MTSSDTILTIADRLSLIERTARAAGYPKATVAIVIRGEGDAARTGSKVAGITVTNAPAGYGFHGPDCLEQAMEWATALERPYADGIGPWFTVEPVAAQAEEAS